MRALLLATAALVAVSAAAQDHADHEGHEPSAQEAMDHAQHAMDPQEEPVMDHSQTDHSQHGQMDHSAMDHSGMDHAAMDHSQMDHSQHGQMDHATMDIPMGPPPPRAFEGPQHAADLYFHPDRMASARAYNHAAHGGMSTGTMLVERLEARLADGHDAYVWDVSAWYGTSTDTLVFKSEGEGEFKELGES